MKLDPQTQFRYDLQQVINHVKSRTRHCMCSFCRKNTIKNSHVLSKSQILKPISENSKIYQFEYRPLFYPEKPIRYSLKGLNEAYTFKGFCTQHDNNIFSPIEPTTGRVDWSDIRNQYLLGYRTLCNELSTQEIVYEINDHLLNYSDSDDPMYKFDLLIKKENLMSSCKTLLHYKTILENGVFNGIYSGYSFKHIELPFQFDLCVCSPIHVDDGKGICIKSDYQESNIVMVFPYYGKTEIIIGYSSDFENIWMNHIVPEFQSRNPLSLSRAFANILYRVEFNAMSSKLYNSLDPSLIELFLKTFVQNASVYSLDIYGVETLFLKPLTQLL